MKLLGELGIELALFGGAAICLLAGFGGMRPGNVAAGPGPKPQATLRVLTWNVGGASGRGGHALSGDVFDDVVATLLAANADLILLQEMDRPSQAERLSRALGSGEWQVVQAPVRGRIVGLFARGGTLIPLEATRIACAALYRRHGWPPIMVVSAHAHAYSSNRRNHELGRIARRLREESSRPPVVFGGDFNLDLDLDKRRDLFSDDAHRDVETYNYISKTLRDTTLGTGSTAEPDRRLDYIFVSREEFRVVAAGPWRDRRVGDMDHDPVFVDLVRRGQ